MRLLVRVVLAALVALLTLGQGSCQQPPAPNYAQPGEAGTAPPEQPALRTWSIWKTAERQNDHPCGENAFTFGVVQDGVTCNAAFDFTPLLRQATAQRDAILFATPCPNRCSNRYVVDNGVIQSCERDGTRARLRLESALHCLANPREFPPSIIPNPLPPGEGRITAAPWTSRMLYEAPFDQPLPPNTCEEQIRIVYREKAACDRITSYRAFVVTAKQEAIRRQFLLQCAAGCAKRIPTEFDYERWSCANNEVVVELVFKPCRVG